MIQQFHPNLKQGTPKFITGLITIAKMWEPPKSVNRWIKKMWNIYVKRNIIHF